MYDLVYNGNLEDIFESGAMDTAPFLGEVVKLWRLRCGPDVLEAAIADIFEPNPEVCELIPRLKERYRLMLGSNTNPIHSRQFLKQFADTLEHFDHVVLSHAIGARKPRTAFFEHCLQLAGCGPEECLFVDDLPANIEGARAAGMRGLVYVRGQGLLESL
jgi:putative hydrolase of the HAD superfamily